MAFRARNANYNALKSLSLRQRLDAASDSSMGQTLISMLTPTQAAELFPRYWIERNPNISGFLKAIPSSMSATRQREYERQIENTASGSAAGSNYDAGGYRKKWQQEIDSERQRSQVTKRFEAPLPQLSPEQKQAFEALKAGDIGVNDDRVKFLKNISDADLTRAGLTRIKDDKGDARYHYQPPQVSDEDAKRSMASRGSSNAFFDSIIRAEGTGAGGRDPYNTVLGYGKYGTPSKPLTQMSISEILQFGDQVRARHGSSSALGAFQIVGSNIRAALKQGRLSLDDKFTPETQRELASYIAKTQGLGAWEGFKLHPKDRQIADSAMQQGLHTNYAGQSDPITQNYSSQQLEAKKRELQSQMEAGRLGELAAITQPGGPTNAASVKGTNKWDSVAPIGGSGYCGRGVASLAMRIYGNQNGIFNGHLGTTKASDLTVGAGRSSNIFTNSGLYASGQSIGKEQLTPEFLASLPPGTIVANHGGGLSSKGAYNAGHIQMKVGGDWMSDHKQKGFLFGANRANGEYNNFTIFYPTEKANKYLHENGYIENMPASAPPSVTNIPPSKPPEDVEQRNDPYGTPNAEVKAAAEAAGITREMQEGRKATVQGSVSFEGGGTYHFGSGRPDDSNFPSTPLGSSEVGGLNPHHVPGGVGYEMPALNNRLDPKVGRTRNGMVIHSSGHDDLERLYSHGCISIPKSEFPAFQQEMENFKKTHGGKAYINIMPDGRVTVTATPAYSSDGTPLTPMSTDQAVKEIQTNQPQVVQSATQVATGDIKPLTSITQPEGPVNAAGPAAPVQQTAAPQAAPTPAPQAAPEQPQTAPTAAVEAPKPAAQPAAPAPERYNVNVDKFTSAIRQTEDFKRQAGMFGSMVPNSTIINGFNDDPRVKAAGVRLDEKGVMHFTKGMTPDVKEVMSTFDTKSFMTKIEDKKKEDAPTKVKAMAEGGPIPVNTEQITAYPIGGLRGDNAVVVNANQKPLFTMNTNEDVVMDPDNNKAHVLPNEKSTSINPMPKQDMSSGLMEEFNSTIKEMRQDFASLKAAKIDKPDLNPTIPASQENGWLGRLNQTAADPFKTPSIRRVAYRAGGMETGDPSTGFHHSRGNNS